MTGHDALHGVRVVEVGTGLATPLAARLLGDIGADVIKVEDSHGDRTRGDTPRIVADDGTSRSALFEYLNLGKRGVVLEPAAGAAQLQSLLACADVLLVGDDLAVWEDWSLTVAGVRREHPHLVVVTVTPFGLTGPKARWRATDLTLQGASGLLSFGGASDRSPLKRGLRSSTYEAGLTAAYTALAGVRVARSGRGGTVVDVSIAECITSELVLQVPEYTYAGLVAARRPPQRDPFQGDAIEVSNGYVTMQTSMNLPISAYADYLGAPVLNEARFATPAGRARHAAALGVSLSDALHGEDPRGFFERSARAGLLTGYSQRAEQLLACPQLAEREAFAAMPGLLGGRPWRMPFVTARLTRTPAKVPGPAPRLGEHDARAIIEEWSHGPLGARSAPEHASRARLAPGQSVGDGGAISRSGAAPGDGPLAGVRVIDLSAVFAAPYMGALLADLGADVIRVEAPQRLDQTRGGGFGPYLDNDPGDDGWNWSGAFQSVNRGKRSIVLDLQTSQGRAVARRLIDGADIVLENNTPRVMRGWGMTYDALIATNPRLILLSNTGYGSTGPWSEFKAQGTTLESTMGLLEYTGYLGGKPTKVGQSYPDFLAAWTGLYAMMAALIERDASGRGQWIDLGMYQLGGVVIPEALIAKQAGTPLDPPRIGNREIDTWLSGVYPCAGDDEWATVAIGSESEAAAAWALIGGTGANPEPETLAAALGEWTRTRTGPEVGAVLQAAGIAASHVARVRDVLLDPQYRARSFFEWVEVRGSRRPVIGRPYTWSGDTRVGISRPAPLFGEHNDEVSAEAGLSPGQVEELRAQNVVVDQPIDPLIPRAADIASLIAVGTYARLDGNLRDVLRTVRS